MLFLWAKNKRSKRFAAYMHSLAGQKGFTILEILATIAVFSLVLVSVFTFYQLGLNTYHHGLMLLDLQQNIRLAGDFINREMRHAINLQLNGASEVRYRLPDDANRYAIKQKNKEIVLLINNTETKIAYDIESLYFNWDATRKILYYTIEGTASRQNYRLRSAVLLQNMGHAL